MVQVKGSVITAAYDSTSSYKYITAFIWSSKSVWNKLNVVQCEEHKNTHLFAKVPIKGSLIAAPYDSTTLHSMSASMGKLICAYE